MANVVVDSLESVETLLALEEQLGEVDKRFPGLAQYLVEPFQCQSSVGAVSWVFARRGVAVLFASFEQAQFGIGALLPNGTIQISGQFESFEAAARAFLTGKGAHDI